MKIGGADPRLCGPVTHVGERGLDRDATQVAPAVLLRCDGTFAPVGRDVAVQEELWGWVADGSRVAFQRALVVH